MKKSVKLTQTKFFNEALTEDCYNELPPRDELERILPLQNIPEMQEYLLRILLGGIQNKFKREIN